MFLVFHRVEGLVDGRFSGFVHGAGGGPGDDLCRADAGMSGQGAERAGGRSARLVVLARARPSTGQSTLALGLLSAWRSAGRAAAVVDLDPDQGLYRLMRHSAVRLFPQA